MNNVVRLKEIYFHIAQLKKSLNVYYRVIRELWMRNSRLNRTTVIVRMICPPVYYQRYTSLRQTLFAGKTIILWLSFVVAAFFLYFCARCVRCLLAHTTVTDHVRVCLRINIQRKEKWSTKKYTHAFASAQVHEHLTLSTKQYSRECVLLQ